MSRVGNPSLSVSPTVHASIDRERARRQGVHSSWYAINNTSTALVSLYRIQLIVALILERCIASVR